MIIRKPYKFLIKNFRIINLVLLLLMGFVTFKCGMLFNFFNSYVNTQTVDSSINLVNHYIGFLFPLCTFLVIVISLFIYALFKSKDKDNKAYLLNIIFYTIVFILGQLCKGSVLDLYTYDSIDLSASLIYRDVARFVFYPNFLFIILIFINFIGFDFSTFSFINLADELEIAEEDDAQIEIGTNISDYKVKRSIRKTIRELWYYVVENKIVFEFIGGLLGLFVLYNGFLGVKNLFSTVKIAQSFSQSSFNISIQDSMLTDIDYSGNIIREGYYYLAVLVNVSNVSDSSEVLETNKFWLDLGDSYVFPTNDKSSKFVDFGEPYYGDKIKSGENHSYVIVYELDSSQLKNNYEIRILDSIIYKNGVATPKYKLLKLKPTVYYGINDNGNALLTDTLKLDKTNLLSSTFKIKSYEFSSLYNYKYESCYKGECKDYMNVIVPSSMKKVLIVISDELTLDSNSTYVTFKKNSNFYEDFVLFTYEYNGVTYYSTVTDKSATNDKDKKVVLELDRNILYGDNVQMIITIRNQRYQINLTEDSYTASDYSEDTSEVGDSSSEEVYSS